MPDIQQVTVDRDGHRLHIGDWVYYGGSVLGAYGITEITEILGDGTMNLETAAGVKLRGAHRTSVRFDCCKH